MVMKTENETNVFAFVSKQIDPGVRSRYESEVVLVVFCCSLIDEVEGEGGTVSKRIIILVVDERNSNHVQTFEAIIYFDIIDPVL